MKCWAKTNQGTKCANKTKGIRPYCHLSLHKSSVFKKSAIVVLITIPGVLSAYLGIITFCCGSEIQDKEVFIPAKELKSETDTDTDTDTDTLSIFPYSKKDFEIGDDSLVTDPLNNPLEPINSRASLAIVKVFSPKPGFVELQLLNASEKVVLLSDIKFNDTLSPASANFFRSNTKVYQRIIHNSSSDPTICENTTFAFKRPIAISQEISPQSTDRFSVELKLEESLVKRRFNYNGTITLYYNGSESVVSDSVKFTIQ